MSGPVVHPLAHLFDDGRVPLEIAIAFEHCPRDGYRAARLAANARLELYEIVGEEKARGCRNARIFRVSLLRHVDDEVAWREYMASEWADHARRLRIAAPRQQHSDVVRHLREHPVLP